VTRIDRALLERLPQFFERITPPEEATPREYITWIEDLLGRDPASVREQRTDTDPTVSLSVNDGQGLSFYARVRHPLEEMQHKSEVGQNVAVRDVYAMQAFRACLNEILRAYDLLAEQMMGGVEPLMTWAQFRIELGLAVEGHQAQQVGGDYRNGRVLFSRLDEARGLIHDHIYILGLAEGLFPAQIQEDPLYSDRERKKLQDEAGFEVQTSTDRVDSGLIFYEACAMARETLTLSRPTLDEKANPWPPSILWREVNTILKDAPTLRIRAGAAPLVEETADMREAGVAVAAAISQQLVSVNDASGVLASLLGDATHSSRWVNILRGRAIEARRENIRQPFDQFSGILRQPELIAKVAAQLGVNRQWSATQFNDYGYCPFRFFSKRVLRLEELEEPEEGLDAAQLGSVQHEVLENTYLQILAEGFVIAPENVGRALELLHEEAAKCLPTAPQRWGFRPTPLWKHEQAEIMSRLTQLIKLDFSESTKSPFVLNPRSKNPVAVVVEEIGGTRAVFALEQAFGMDGKPNAVIDGAAGPLKVRGKIDRIDRVGNTLIVMDYKSGTKTPKNQDIEEGRNFQMLLYLLAAQQIIQQEHPELIVQVGMFWSIRTQKAETSAQILANDPLFEEAEQTRAS
jgi:ATP-dependent helicase/nuclease subunit B